MLIIMAGRLSSPHFNGLVLISITDVPLIEGIRTQRSHLYDLSVHQNARVEIHTDSSLRQLYMCRLLTQT